jgi:hypothetical protein
VSAEKPTKLLSSNKLHKEKEKQEKRERKKREKLKANKADKKTDYSNHKEQVEPDVTPHKKKITDKHKSTNSAVKKVTICDTNPLISKAPPAQPTSGKKSSMKNSTGKKQQQNDKEMMTKKETKTKPSNKNSSQKISPLISNKKDPKTSSIKAARPAPAAAAVDWFSAQLESQVKQKKEIRKKHTTAGAESTASSKGLTSNTHHTTNAHQSSKDAVLAAKFPQKRKLLSSNQTTDSKRNSSLLNKLHKMKRFT